MEQKFHPSNRGMTTPLVICGVSFLLYFITLAPTYSWGDSADFAIRLAIGDQGWEGTPRDYDIFDFVLGLFRNLGIGSIQARANLVAAIFGAISVGLTTFFALIISKSMKVATFSGCILMVSHTFWLMSVTAEVYTFNLILILLVYINIFKYNEKRNYKSIFFVGSFTGLCLSHHSTGLIVVFSQASLLYVAFKEKHFKELLIWFMSLLIFGHIYISRVIDALSSKRSILDSFGVYRSANFLNETNNFIEILKFIGFLIYNFPTALVILVSMLIFWSLDVRFQKRLLTSIRFSLPYEPLIFSAIIILGGIWSTIPDKHNIFILSYPFVSILIGRTIVCLFGISNMRNLKFISVVCSATLLSPLFYLSTYRIASDIGINVSGARVLNYRDNNKYFLWPPKNGDYGPELLVDEILRDLPINSIIIADYTILMPLAYQLKVENKRSDVIVVSSELVLDSGLSDFFDKNSNRRVFLATDTPPNYYGINNLDSNFSLKRKGVIVELLRVGNGG